MFIYSVIKKPTIKNLFKTGLIFLCGAWLSAAQAAPTDSVRDQNVKARHYQELKQKFKTVKSSKSFSLQKSVAQENTVRIIVETTDTGKTVTALQSVERSAKASGAAIKRKVDRLHVVALTVNEKQLDDLYANSSVKILSEDEVLTPTLSVSVPYIGAKTLQNAGFKGSGQAVAIFDTGFDTSHPFLGGRVVEEACFSSGDQQTVLSLCPNGQNRQTGAGAAHDCSASYPGSDCIHGTHVAGIAAGGNESMTGVAPQANIVAVQIFTYNTQSGRLGAYTSDILAAFDWLLNESHTPNIAAVNMSLGGGLYTSSCDDSVPALTSAIQALRARGAATVIASGNDGYSDSVSWPGCISSAVTVGATYPNYDFVAWFSNMGPQVDIVAPGLDIYSSAPGNNYYSMSGTSMATPHVTGAFALLKSFKPTATVDQIEQALKQGGVTHPEYDFNVPRLDLVGASALLTTNDCKTLPGEISSGAIPLAVGEEKNWNSFAPQGGLFRVWVGNAASGGSNLVNVTLNGVSVDIAVSAGNSSLVDFANVNAGPLTLTIKALSAGFSLGHVWVEKIASNNTSSTTGCALPVPGVVAQDVNAIPLNTEKTWPITIDTNKNLRLAITSTSALNSRTIAVKLDNTTVNISINSSYTAPVDFANVPKGIHQVSLKALTSDVSVGKFEVINY